MRTAPLLALVVAAGCGGSRPHGAAVDNLGGDAVEHAPCYPGRDTVPARELYDAAKVGPPGNCHFEAEAEETGGEREPETFQAIYDGATRVAVVTPCGLDVYAKRIPDDRGVLVGDDVNDVLAVYPRPDTLYSVAGGLDGGARLTLEWQGLILANLTFDGMADGSSDGDAAVAALAGQRVTSYSTSYDCD